MTENDLLFENWLCPRRESSSGSGARGLLWRDGERVFFRVNDLFGAAVSDLFVAQNGDWYRNACGYELDLFA